MQTMRERHGKTPVQREVSVVMKKAYCGFERLEKEHDDRIRAFSRISGTDGRGPGRLNFGREIGPRAAKGRSGLRRFAHQVQRPFLHFSVILMS